MPSSATNLADRATVIELALAGSRDPGSTRLIYVIVVTLVVLGVGLAGLAWWLFRETRPDPELLAPLEAIQSRKWRRLDPAGRRRMLDGLRPTGAEPERREPLEPSRDVDFDGQPSIRDVRELAGDGIPRDGDWSAWDGQLGLARRRSPDGDEVSPDGDEVSPDGGEVSPDGDEVSPDADDVAAEVVEESPAASDDEPSQS